LITPDWAGQPAFIICGGPSAAEQGIERLRGRRVIVINASVKAAPWADILIFADDNPWRWYRSEIEAFNGRVVKVYDGKPSARFPVRFEQYRKTRPPVLSRDPSCLTLARTTTTGAINLAAHLGSRLIVTLGLDGKRSEDGRSHHHKPHPKPPMLGCWEKHRKELCSIVPSLKEWGVEVLNASPGSACDAFPIVTLDEALARIDMRRAA
jgi:hypothetical protein